MSRDAFGNDIQSLPVGIFDSQPYLLELYVPYHRLGYFLLLLLLLLFAFAALVVDGTTFRAEEHGWEKKQKIVCMVCVEGGRKKRMVRTSY